MALVEINFDGIVGPSHNYAGLSLGNLAATANKGADRLPARRGAAGPREDARTISRSAWPRACSFPTAAPIGAWLAALGAEHRGRAGPRCAPPPFRPRRCGPPMPRPSRPRPTPPTAAATSPSPICGPMPHRSHEWPETLAQLRLAFADDAHFAVHAPGPADASATRARPTTCGSAPRHGEPRRRDLRLWRARRRLPGAPACRGVAGGRPAPRARSGAHPVRRPVRAAIAAGAFHNDVVAVANEHVLFAHEQAFADTAGLLRRAEAAAARGRDRRGAGQRGQPRRRDPHLPVQRPAGHAARRAAWR